MVLYTFNVIEILELAASLKYSPDPEKRAIKIKDILEDLELTKVQNVKAGERDSAGANILSRGEKKRLSIAIELITNPALIFMDEPTTSMDTFTAEKIIEIIRKLASKGKTIIATIHQPNSEIYKKLDRLMLLSYGHTIYFVLYSLTSNRENLRMQYHTLMP